MRQILVLALIALISPIFPPWPALATGSTLQLEFQDNQLSLSAKDADIKTILLKLSEAANIYVQFPEALQKDVNINLSRVTLEKALSRLLKGLNYATVFSVSIDSDRPKLTRVYIYRGFKESVRTRSVARRTRRLQTRINNYEKQIRVWQKRLSTLDRNSSAGQRYQRLIRNYEKKIDRIKRQLQ